MPKGSGAFVLHKMIESRLTGYRVVGYSPWLTLFPLLLPHVMAGLQGRVIHTCPDYGLFFRRPRTPLVMTIHNYVCDAFMRPYSGLLQQLHYATDLKWFIRRSIQAATVLTSVSDYSARLIGTELNLKRTVRVISNGVDEKRFIPVTRRSRSGSVQVLFSGNLTLRKGVQWLPTIAARLGRGILIQYTSGLGNSTLRPKMPNTIDLGRVAWEDMPGVYQASDILISPTVREGLSLAILEAMACGLPVVASDCSSLPELIDDGKGGFLCPVGDTGAFAERINLLASTPELRRQMGEYNRAKVEKMFTLERMVSEYRGIFDSLL
jgi:L-malate glycosyltransferase